MKPESENRIPIVIRQRQIEIDCANAAKDKTPHSISAYFFVPSILTPMYISEQAIKLNDHGLHVLTQISDIPEGLIAKEKMNDEMLDTVGGRVLSVREMLRAGIPITIFCHAVKRPKVDGLQGYVDDTEVKQLLEQYPTLLKIIIIPKEEYDKNKDNLPAAMYVKNDEFHAVYSQQISDPYQPNHPWGIDNTHKDFFGPLKALCDKYQIEFPLNKGQDHFLRFVNSWEQSSEWKKIIYEGNFTLTTQQNKDPIIYNCMSAASFYLSNYEDTEKYAKEAEAIAIQSQQYDEQCRALYLQSSACRASKRFDEAVRLCKKAQEIYTTQQLNNPRLLAKIKFNLLAAHMDNPKDNHPIDELANEIIAIFNQLGEDEEAARVHIRMANYFLQRNLPIENAASHLAQVSNTVKQGKNRITGQYFLANGRLNVAQGNTDTAQLCFAQSMEMAKKLYADEDYKRAQAAIEALPTHTNKVMKQSSRLTNESSELSFTDKEKRKFHFFHPF